MSLYENWMEKAFSKDGRSIEGVWVEAAGIQEGDTVKMYGLAFEYFR